MTSEFPGTPPKVHSPPVMVLRAILRTLVTIVVVFYTLLDALLFVPMRPLVRWLGSLRLFEAVAALIQRLPPYVVLLLLAVPFVLVEPLKIFAIYWGATGHPVQGVIILIFAQIASILTLDRIYHVGKVQLHKIGWFKRLMTWLAGIRDRALGWAKSTAIWQASARTARAIRAWFAGLLAGSR